MRAKIKTVIQSANRKTERAINQQKLDDSTTEATD
jgi:hypothetical protein